MDENRKELIPGYEAGPDFPLRAYLSLSGVFTLSTLSGMCLAGARLPERWTASDLALLGISTYKLTEIVGNERVTSPLRAPFRKFQGEGEGSHIREEPRGHGLQKAVGELLGCPYCLGP